MPPQTAASFREIQSRALAAARDGYTLDEIDAQIIVPSGLDEEAMAAIWIGAKYEIDYHRTRYAAGQSLAFLHIGHVDGTD